MVDVFISYARADQAAVRRLAEAVKREGYAIWWDDELPPHRSYSDVITEQIGAARAAIVVWSESAAASEWVRAEADVARNQKKLIQTSLDGRQPPMPFNQIQFAQIGDWRGEDDHPGWRKVKESLAALAGEAARTAYPMPSTPPPGASPPAPRRRSGLLIGAVLASLLALAAIAL
ncbi:MAG TPA: toll/interleukin-1 receptor domain-containing protein, partial [Allosphingosinicella sp.]|nr:toll/interleukin-1 receptor domain-containing protein [Allosphingosinicella sp.]